MLVVPARAWSQQGGQHAAQAQDQSAAATAPAQQQESLAEAARRAREQKKDTSKQAKVFTNDNIPSQGGISTVGDTSQGSNSTADNATTTADAKKGSGNEKMWREKFAQLRHKAQQDQENLDVMQRELGVLNTQFYGDPMKALQQGYTRSDINQKIADIDKMKVQIAADNQALDDAESELRRSGGDPGWAR
jgi:hypothetical protein